MNFVSPRSAGRFASVLLLSMAVAFGQETQDPEIVLEEEVTSASPEEVKRLLGAYQSAATREDATEIADVLAGMSAHQNDEFRDPALTGLAYRASRLDKRAAGDLAQELDMRSKKDIERFVLEREAGVQEAAAHVLANIPGKSSTRALAKAFKDKKIRKRKPKVTAAVIRALGKLGYDRVEKDVFRQMGMYSDKDVTRACVRYLGQIKTREFAYVRTLVEMLDPPQPFDVNGKNNPPASYWAALWEQWSWARRDVAWSLKEITGQTFRPQDGENPSDGEKALLYIKEHKAELRLR